MVNESEIGGGGVVDYGVQNFWILWKWDIEVIPFGWSSEWIMKGGGGARENGEGGDNFCCVYHVKELKFFLKNFLFFHRYNGSIL